MHFQSGVNMVLLTVRCPSQGNKKVLIGGKSEKAFLNGSKSPLALVWTQDSTHYFHVSIAQRSLTRYFSTHYFHVSKLHNVR